MNNLPTVLLYDHEHLIGLLIHLAAVRSRRDLQAELPEPGGDIKGLQAWLGYRAKCPVEKKLTTDKNRDMQRKIICILIFLLLSAFPVHAENARDYFDLGLKSIRTREKINYFSRALELDPSLTEVYEKRGMLYFFQKKYDNVIQDFQAYIDRSPPKAEAYRMLGMGYLKNGDYRSAIRTFTRTIEIDAGLSGAYSGRAETHYLSGNYDEAILDSTRAIDLGGDPRNIAETYRTRAKAYRKIGKTDLAAMDIRSSWLIDPRYAVYMRSFYSYANPDGMRKAGLIAIIGIAFVIIFKFKLKPPEKDE